ncbi:MAG: ammonium transporter [Kiritimatiellae bacterium]|nr:ammonium transporter [Kiritimatiellia bacterium]
MNRAVLRVVAGATVLLAPLWVYAADGGPALEGVEIGLNTLWVLLAAFLVFFMQAGFGMVEAGFIRAKNACNILTKNFLDFCIACLSFWVLGYALMFGSSKAGLIGAGGFLLRNVDSLTNGVPTFAFWLFQAAFCGAAATIVAGAMAERMKFRAYLAYTVVISGLVYPVVGHWVWGGGWLARLGFADFAGSTVVHATGGIAALVGAAVLGPRIGKFNRDGSANAMPGHNIPLASLGVFILWFGWFGFNPGSSLSGLSAGLNSRVAINTNLAACAGTVSAMAVVWLLFGKPDLSMAMNGALAGLVAITAPCAYVSVAAAVIIGLVAGVIIVLGVALLDRVGIDDPVGAVPVHGLNGVWGTLAVGLFGQKALLGGARAGLFAGGGLKLLGIQTLGVAACAGFVALSMGTAFLVIRRVIGLRVSEADELRGLDIGEHGMESYSGFQIFVTK